MEVQAPQHGKHPDCHRNRCGFMHLRGCYGVPYCKSKFCMQHATLMSCSHTDLCRASASRLHVVSHMSNKVPDVQPSNRTLHDRILRMDTVFGHAHNQCNHCPFQLCGWILTSPACSHSKEACSANIRATNLSRAKTPQNAAAT